MEARFRSLFRSWWQQIKQRPYTTGVVVVLGLILFIFSANRFGWDWTGFNSGTSQITITSTSKVNYTATISQPSKSLWDWLQLLAVLAIPVVVGIGAAWYTAQQGKVSDRENTDNQREAALQEYIDKISELLLDENLGEGSLSPEPPTPQVLAIAQARTATVLQTLDPNRRGSLIQFLSRAGILNTCTRDALVDIDLHKVNLLTLKLSKINLAGANLEEAVLWATDLSKANLYKANLTKAFLGSANFENAQLDSANLFQAKLIRANLSKANLSQANLSQAYLGEANLESANMEGTDLSQAYLGEANLESANMEGADLRNAFLKNARVSEEQLNTVKSLKGATMLDGSIHP